MGSKVNSLLIIQTEVQLHNIASVGCHTGTYQSYCVVPSGIREREEVGFDKGNIDNFIERE